MDEYEVHCDAVMNDVSYPLCLRNFIRVNRMPAIEKRQVVTKYGWPKCFATYDGKRVRINMASRFGDVGFTENLNQEFGYEYRATLDWLSDFSEEP